MTTASWRDKGEVEGWGRAEERKQRVKKEGCYGRIEARGG